MIRRRHLIFSGLACGIAIAGLAIAYVIHCDIWYACRDFYWKDKFYNFYATNLRASLFTGFLTLGGFLMSLKTFIVVNMKKEVFDKEPYEKLWRDKRERDNNVNAFRYDPLKKLSNSILITIVACISSSVSQLTIGLIPVFYTAAFCLVASAIAIGLLLSTLWSIQENLELLFEHLEEDQRVKEERANEEKRVKEERANEEKRAEEVCKT